MLNVLNLNDINHIELLAWTLRSIQFKVDYQEVNDKCQRSNYQCL